MNTEKYDQYDQVVEVKKYVKKPWTTSCLDFSINEEDTYLMREASIRQTNYYLCERDGRIYLVDSDNEVDEIFGVDLTNFVEIEIDGFIYRKYRYIK